MVAGMVFLAVTGGRTSSAQPTMRAADFLDTIGVNVHVTYTDSSYVKIDAVVAALRYLGVNHVRDYSLSPGGQGQASYGRLARAGIRFNLFQQGGDVAAAVDRMQTFVQIFPGSIASIEGPNEVNNFPIRYGGLTGDAAAKAFMAAFYDAIKAVPSLADIPVYGITSWPEFASKADVANFHSYPPSGDQPLARLTRDRNQQLAAMPGKPTALTESGYYTLPGKGTWGGVDDATQAGLILNLLFDATRLGVGRTFIYQLLDAYPDPDGSDMEKHFGLFDIAFAPKPAATALRNLTTILADPGADARTFATRSLPHTVKGLPATAGTLLLQKASGAFQLVFWNEPDVWDETANKPIPVGTETVTLDLGGTFPTVRVFDPVASGDATRTLTDVRELRFDIGAHPVIVEIAPAASESLPKP